MLASKVTVDRKWQKQRFSFHSVILVQETIMQNPQPNDYVDIVYYQTLRVEAKSTKVSFVIIVKDIITYTVLSSIIRINTTFFFRKTKPEANKLMDIENKFLII